MAEWPADGAGRLVDARCSGRSRATGAALRQRPARGQVEGVQGQFASVLAADGGKVNVKLARPPDFESSFVEFVGTVDAPNQITELDRTSFGNTFGAPSHRPPLAPAWPACGTLAVESQQCAPARVPDCPSLCTSRFACSEGVQPPEQPIRRNSTRVQLPVQGGLSGRARLCGRHELI